jgi:hypothetical protein
MLAEHDSRRVLGARGEQGDEDRGQLEAVHFAAKLSRGQSEVRHDRGVQLGAGAGVL